MEERFDTTWDPDDLPTTERMLAGFKLEVKATGDPYLFIQLAARIAHCQLLQDRYEAVQETLNEIEYVLLDADKRLPNADQRHAARARGRTRLEKARFLRRAGLEEGAIFNQAEALRWARIAEDTELERLAQSIDS